MKEKKSKSLYFSISVRYNECMVIYKSTPAVIRNKSWHVNKIGGRPRKAFCNHFGDIPVATYNEQTKKLESVVNTRGNSYAFRNDMKFYKNEK